jgi:F-box/leucine-rich repeat protein 2/20
LQQQQQQQQSAKPRHTHTAFAKSRGQDPFDADSFQAASSASEDEEERQERLAKEEEHRREARLFVAAYKGSQTDMVARLPNELLCHLLLFLDFPTVMASAVRVNRAWRWALRDEECWRTVAIRNLTQCNDRTIAASSSCWARLNEADFSGCQLGDSGVHTLALNCSELKTLSLSRCVTIGDQALRSLAHHCPLTSLDVSFCEKVTDAGVGSLAKGLRGRLHTLNLQRCRSVQDPALYQLARHCPQLRNLDLTWCRQVTDKGLGVLASRCTRLRVLKLRWCALVTDLGVCHLTRHARALEHLSLDHCRELTDTSVGEIAQHLDQLRSLSLLFCDKLTDTAVTHLKAARCLGLISLTLDYCDHVSVGALQSLLVFEAAPDSIQWPEISYPPTYSRRASRVSTARARRESARAPVSTAGAWGIELGGGGGDNSGLDDEEGDSEDGWGDSDTVLLEEEGAPISTKLAANFAATAAANFGGRPGSALNIIGTSRATLPALGPLDLGDAWSRIGTLNTTAAANCAYQCHQPNENYADSICLNAKTINPFVRCCGHPRFRQDGTQEQGRHSCDEFGAERRPLSPRDAQQQVVPAHLPGAGATYLHSGRVCECV